MKKRLRKFWILWIVLISVLVIGYQVLSRVYLEKNKDLRTRIREGVEQRYPDLTDKMRSEFGIKPAEREGAAPGGNESAGDVILVHGMDDWGKVWMNVSPYLLNHGFNVWILTYPDDQPVSESARLFFEEMAVLEGKGIGDVSIVAHSMGGLVAREMLSNPEFSYGRAALEGMVPKVVRLIMIGTPNHGSELASFRIIGEVRDQFSSLFLGDYIWLQGILDGAGEAGLDLVPGSPFLTELNDRPYPENVDMVVIAGVMTPGAGNAMEELAGKMKSEPSNHSPDSVTRMKELLISMATGLGDGLVSVDSAKLDGLPLRIVEGNHLSIVRNLTEDSERIPPAIPVVMEYLQTP